MEEKVKIKKSSKKSESSEYWGKNQKIFVHPRTELRTPRFCWLEEMKMSVGVSSELVSFEETRCE